MSKIYKYSYCSIAATAAKDDGAGCFRDRDPLLDLPVQIDFSSIAADPPERAPMGKVAKDERRITIEGTYYMQWERTWFFEIGFSPLIDRAWVVQERLLAPRVLHFANTQLYWECNELRACESYPNEMPQEQYTKVDYKTIFPFSEGVKQNISDLQEEGQRKLNFGAWGVIVQGYSQAKLTQEGDKLIAISAIAREMKLLMQCKYLAGHWETDLVRQLGWPGYDISSRPTTYRAPSWSWASVDGRNQFWYKMYSYDIYHALAEVSATHIDLAGEDEMGPVTGGYLDILSQLFELEIREKSEEEKRHSPRRSGQPILIQGQATAIRFHQDGPESRLDGPLYFMPLSLSINTEYEDLEVNGLALQRFCQQDMYRRVGSVESGIGYKLLRDDLILKILGEIEWGENFEFTRNSSNMKTIRIV
ncbi:hypothetical protein G7Y79_00060g092310 [Physcia stellaris]|nr:hypothetical protein G7Y79_00060g092310 [Physcia stellaris]